MYAASQSSSRRSSDRAMQMAPTPSLTPSQDGFEPCAATAAFFLYSQRNIILCLHQDTLSIERRFERHQEDVRWIEVDNHSEKGAGRMVVSYDSSMTTIVWDLFTGDEIARFASFEELRVSNCLRNGNIAFGNTQGNVILFEPSTKEHLSVRTIYSPITSLAAAADCKTFAIGYQNGSILIAALQPSFTILHTLSTQRQPSPIVQLAWHGSSSKQKSDMLASQTMDGDLRVWSVPKGPIGDPPTVIRNFQQQGFDRISGPCWFAWSKTGRIVQYIDGSTYSWDVRTKRVTYESVPTIEGIVGITNYGPTAVLFTLGRNHTVQQYDISPSGTPMLVKNVQHVPANLPPSPPISDGDQAKISSTVTAGAPDPRSNLPLYFESDGSDYGAPGAMSPLARIAQDTDQSEEEEEESRDILAPLSPVSSRSSNISQASSKGKAKRTVGTYPTRWERSQSSRLRPNSPGIASISSHAPSTVFSSGSSSASNHRPLGSSSRLRQEILRSPDEAKSLKSLDLFPYIKARLSDVPFRPPVYDGPRTSEVLRREMLHTVFGWDGDIDELIDDELSRHEPGSASAVLLSKWIGDDQVDLAASMVGSESMTSSDWMLLALSAVGKDSQKKVGEAFVQRLLEKGDIHPAVAILLGLGEYNEAIEIYVSRRYYMEAVLLTSLVTPNDWHRQSHLVRKWGEVAISNREPELAVRCFACASVESTEAWFSPQAKDAVYAAQQMYMAPETSPSATTPTSPPTSANPNRLAPSQAGLKLITNFHPPKGGKLPSSALDEKTPMIMTGVTPIDTAFTPAIGRQPRGFFRADPASAVTATPGGLTSRRLTSRERRDELMTPGDTARTAKPISAIRKHSEDDWASRRARSSSASVVTTSSKGLADHLPSPAQGAFSQTNRTSRMRNGSRDRKPDGLSLNTSEIVVEDPGLQTATTHSSFRTHTASPSVRSRRADVLPSPAMTETSLKSAKLRSIDQYVNSVNEANHRNLPQRAESRTRGVSETRTMSRGRAPSATSDTRGRRYIKPAKRSPSSPVSMSPDDPALQMHALTKDSSEDERFYKVASPTESSHSRQARARSKGPQSVVSHPRSASKTSRRAESTSAQGRVRSRSRPAPSRAESRPQSPDREPGRRGGSRAAGEDSARRSPESPLPMVVGAEDHLPVRRPRDQSIGAKVRSRGTSANRVSSPDRSRPRSRSQNARAPSGEHRTESPPRRASSRQMSRSRMPRLQTNFSDGPETASKTLAAKELEARRLSLARRPSAPAIPHPNEFTIPRSATDPVMIPTEHMLIRSHTADPEASKRFTQNLGTSTTSVPIGLPATPRAMRHPKYMTSDPNEEGVPAVPQLPSGYSQPNTEQPPPPPPLASGESLLTLPSAVFQPPNRAASAPPEKVWNTSGGTSPRRSSRQDSFNMRPPHQRMGSLNEIVVSPPPKPDTEASDSGAQILESSVIIIEESGANRGSVGPILPELQHLTTPPPPPPPPIGFHQVGNASATSLGVINIAIDENGAATPQMPSLSPTPVVDVSSTSPPGGRTSPLAHRRGRGSISENPNTSGGMGAKLRGVRDRLRDRSESRKRNKSPPRNYQRSPYESIPEPPEFHRIGSAPPMTMRPEAATQPMRFSGEEQRGGAAESLATLAPKTYSATPNPSQMVRGPKEIRAQMNQDQIQFGLDANQMPERPATTNPSSAMGHRAGQGMVRANMPPSSLQPGVSESKPTNFF